MVYKTIQKELLLNYVAASCIFGVCNLYGNKKISIIIVNCLVTTKNLAHKELLSPQAPTPTKDIDKIMCLRPYSIHTYIYAFTKPVRPSTRMPIAKLSGARAAPQLRTQSKCK